MSDGPRTDDARSLVSTVNAFVDRKLMKGYRDILSDVQDDMDTALDSGDSAMAWDAWSAATTLRSLASVLAGFTKNELVPDTAKVEKEALAALNKIRRR